MRIDGFGTALTWQETAYGFCKEVIDTLAENVKYVVVKAEYGVYDDDGYATEIESTDGEHGFGWVYCQYRGNNTFILKVDAHHLKETFGYEDRYDIVAKKFAKKLDDLLG